MCLFTSSKLIDSAKVRRWVGTRIPCVELELFLRHSAIALFTKTFSLRLWISASTTANHYDSRSALQSIQRQNREHRAMIRFFGLSSGAWSARTAKGMAWGVGCGALLCATGAIAAATVPGWPSYFAMGAIGGPNGTPPPQRRPAEMTTSVASRLTSSSNMPASTVMAIRAPSIRRPTHCG